MLYKLFYVSKFYLGTGAASQLDVLISNSTLLGNDEEQLLSNGSSCDGSWVYSKMSLGVDVEVAC